MKKKFLLLCIIALALLGGVPKAGASTTTNNNLVLMGFLDVSSDISFGSLTNVNTAAYLIFTNNSIQNAASQAASYY